MTASRAWVGKAIALLLVLVASSNSAFAQEQVAVLATLRVTVSHPSVENADVRVGLYTSADNWLDEEPVFGGLAETTDSLTTVTFDALPVGTYGAAIYLDENRNGKLDRNLIGFFKESFGFSEQARARLGPPKWEDARFEVAGDVVNISVRLD